MEFRLEFLEDAFVVVFPELLRGVLSGDPGEDLLAACEAASMVLSTEKGLNMRAYLDAHLGIVLGRRRPRRW